MLRSLLSKEDFMKKYAPSDSTYRRRTQEMRKLSQFKKGYIQVTSNEVWIDEAVYQDFLIWKSENRFRAKGVN